MERLEILSDENLITLDDFNEDELNIPQNVEETEEIEENPKDENETNVEETEENEENENKNNENNFYFTLASTLKEDGVFTIEDDELKEIKDNEGFYSLIEKEVSKRLDEKQRRIDQALGNNVEIGKIKEFEEAINYINKIDINFITSEQEGAEEQRKIIIKQDFINKGFTPERAESLTMKSIKAGDDIEDVKLALEENKKFINDSYKQVLNSAKEKQEEQKRKDEEQINILKKDILEGKSFLGDETLLTPKIRKEMVDVLFTPIVDKETGMQINKLHKYQKENQVDYLKNVSYLYVITDGFKNLNKAIDSKVNKKLNKEVNTLEQRLRNTEKMNGKTNIVGISDTKTNLKSEVLSDEFNY
ncbi:MAG: hypothetical protein LBM96_05765 [Methanobrevibacter sp.]|jgi:hypothetical protein|nr:hypothetical protein [Candidatus Methanoflexus mossambicus]